MGVTPLRARVRPPIVDGLFYPAKSDQLATLVDQLIASSPTPAGACFAAISPHAAYELAGPVMASAFRCVARRSARTVMLVGPVHRDPRKGFFLPESETFATPVGEVAVDERLVSVLLGQDPTFVRNDIYHLEEHCLEVQLPFVARVFPGAAVVPILVGSRGVAAASALAEGLGAALEEAGDSTVCIVSSNMASYMTGKDTDSECASAEALLAAGDWRALASAEERKKISACGATPIAALLRLAGEGCKVEVLGRACSRDKGDDPSRTVHYAAVGMDKEPLAD
ncbi:MAG TPA: AmmeMemoRadiSam system protein B [Spirochaetia bacterium]|nr:AmmeMemoRadiSam system protein B [Spirochaetia bacterium]